MLSNIIFEILEKHPSEASYTKLEKYLRDVIEQFRSLMPLGFPLLGIRSMAPEWNIPDEWWFSVTRFDYNRA